MSDNADEPLLEVTDGAAPADESKPKKPKKGMKGKLKDRLQRLSAGDIGAIAPTEAETARNLASLTALSSDETTEDSKKKDNEKVATDQKSITEQKAFDRKEELRNAGIDEEAKHSFYDKVKQSNDKYKKSGFGKAVDRLGKNMKTVGAGAEGMTEQALLETALYNMLMLLFELLFGAKKGIKKLPEGVKWLNANRKREHLYSGALRRYAKEDHAKALKQADGLQKDITDLKQEKADLKKERAQLAEDNKNTPPPLSPEVMDRFREIDARLKENKAELGEKQGKYDEVMLKMAKAENTFQKHGDATKNEKWKAAMDQYKELLPKLNEANAKYKADKKIVKDTPLLQRDEKKAELKLDQQKVELDALKQKELGLYNKIEKLEKSIGKTSAELAELQNASNKNHSEGMVNGRNRAGKISEVEGLISEKVESMKQGEGLVNTKDALQKEQKVIKEAQAELKKTPDVDKTPEQKAEKAALDKREAEIKGKLTNLNGKTATLEMARDKAQAKLDNFTMLTSEKQNKKLLKDPDYQKNITVKLDAAKKNLTEYQKEGADLKNQKAKLTDKIEAYKKLPVGDEKKTPERGEKLNNNFNRVQSRLDKYHAESSGQITQNKQATESIQNSIVNGYKELEPKATASESATPPTLTVSPSVSPTLTTSVVPERPPMPRERAQSAPVMNTGKVGGDDLFSTTALPLKPQPLPSGPKALPPIPPQPQLQVQNIFTTSVEPVPKPTLTSAQTLGEMVDKYAKMKHPVPQDQLMSRFQSLMIEGAVISQQNNMRDFLEHNQQFRPSMTNINDDARRLKTLEIIFAKAYLEHLQSNDSNVRTLTPQQAEQVKAIAKEVANDPQTTSLLKASAEAKLNARIQALRAGAQAAEAKPESEKANIAGDLAIADKDKIKGKDATGEKRKSSTNR